MSTKNRLTTKYAAVRGHLEAAIRNGEFAVGLPLPAEHVLAERFGVSHMTARKAVQDLVQAELLERRARIGTFVRPVAYDRIGKRTLNLVTYEYDGAWIQRFISHGVLLCEREGWYANVIRLTPGYQEPAVRVIQNGEPAIVLIDELDPDSSLAHVMRAAKGRAVLLNSLLAYTGIPSVSYDLERCITLAWDRLYSAGHRKIGLVVQIPEDGNALSLIGYWRTRMKTIFTEQEIESRLIRVDTPRFQSPSVDAFAAMASRFRSGAAETTAVICLGDHLALGVLGAAHKAGRTISAVNIGDSPLLAISIPPVTCVDADVPEQLNQAVDILKQPRYKLDPSDMNIVVSPRLVERESVIPVVEGG